MKKYKNFKQIWQELEESEEYKKAQDWLESKLEYPQHCLKTPNRPTQKAICKNCRRLCKFAG